MNLDGKVQQIVKIGLMSALVFVGSWLQIPLPLETRLHLGNVMCILAGILLGPLHGGLAAGIGSAFFDLTNPIYVSSAPFTFVFKFLMAFVCGIIAYGKDANGDVIGRNIVGGAAGIVTYIILYLSKGIIKDLFFLNLEPKTVIFAATQRGLASVINGILAVVIAVPLAKGIKKALDLITQDNHS